MSSLCVSFLLQSLLWWSILKESRSVVAKNHLYEWWRDTWFIIVFMSNGIWQVTEASGMRSSRRRAEMEQQKSTCNSTAFILPVSIRGDMVDSIPAKSDCKERWREDKMAVFQIIMGFFFLSVRESLELVDEAVDREMTSSHWHVYMKENLGNEAARQPRSQKCCTENLLERWLNIKLH